MLNEHDSAASSDSGAGSPTTPELVASPSSTQEPDPEPEPLYRVVKRNNQAETKNRIATDTKQIFERLGLSDKYCCLALFEPQDSIDAFDLDRIFEALNGSNAAKKRDVACFAKSWRRNRTRLSDQ